MLDPIRLLLLRELADRGTMTAVAAACGYTSSAVSQQLAVLEREAGVPLLERAGRRVRLTHEGERLVAHARIVLAALESAERDLRAADTPRGPVDLACFSTFAAVHVVPALITARELHPELRISLHELEPPEALDALRERRCEVAVGYTYNLTPAPAPPEFEVHPLAVEPVLLAVSAGTDPAAPDADAGPVDLRRLADVPWIVGSREDGSTALVRRVCAIAGFTPRIGHAVDDYQLVLRMVAHGLGVALVPRLAALAHSPGPGVRLRSIAGPEPTRSVHAWTHPSSAARPAVDAVLALLRSAASAD
ncbi:LysR family transcriptional regulator [Streptacidiphilus jiangxiensis]|uniref:DNA-binding transcriptional regulator, LysR family n=1 Tax=Streptacidiphilus jiangxiensis TaxID=235985 RepID=A0A1H7N0D7_STRJI|nr:LysR family transcriptional regulator [Streptacidiphilus jiangxiensis]SEL17022.1 DNA-binding transcriptional regulator, LysR family [Streptacidiphilus jiangxiensis]